jgi:flagellar hook-associated protein 1
MAGSLFGIGLTGLQAAQLGLATTSHNIANASTEGYNRQLLVQGTQIPQLTGSGYVGQGTTVDTIKRAFSDFLYRQVLLGSTQQSAEDSFNTLISQVNNLLADESAGLTPALQDFFSAIDDVANEPGTVVTRQALLGSAQSLVARFQLLEQRLQELGDGVNRQIVSQVAEINSLAAQIAKVNDRIQLAEGTGQQPANDLRDQRDQLVLELNRIIGATVVQQGNSYTVLIGNGVPVVIGTQANAIGTLDSPLEPGRTLVGVVTAGGTVQIQESSLQGGSLGGLLQFRAQALEPAQNQLGRVATVLAGTFNDQHALGQDLNGAAGGAFFNLAPPVINSSSLNAGNAQLAASFSDYGALTASDYRVSYDGANYVFTRLTDGVQQSFAALPALVDGVTVTLASGAPAAGDQFLLRPTVNGASGISLSVSDPTLIAAAAPIRTSRAGTNTGTATISAGSVNAPPPPDPNLTQTVTLTFTSATTFDVAGTGTGNPAGVAYTSGGSISYNGWTVQISGTPAAGDSFTVAANTNGVSDGRNALLLSGLRTQNTIGNGTATYQSAYGQLVSQVGDDTRQSDVRNGAQQSFLAEVRAQRESLSGVNLDEEAANLIRYQQAYQASARSIQVGSQLFQDLLDILR